MKEHFKYNIEELKILLGKRISTIYFKEDFRYPNGKTAHYEPYYNRFSGIQNLGIWFMENEKHFSIKFYCVRNGRFAIKNEKQEENLIHCGVRSIGVKLNDDLNFRKSGSIFLTPATSFGISTNSEIIKKITLQQELREDVFEEYEGRKIYPKLENPKYFPDRIILEGDDLFMLIRAEEDYDQNLHLKLNIGYKFKDESDYVNGLTEPDEMRIITIDKLELE